MRSGDEDGVSNFSEILCVGEQDLNFRESPDRALMATVPDSGTIEVTCHGDEMAMERRL